MNRRTLIQIMMGTGAAILTPSFTEAASEPAEEAASPASGAMPAHQAFACLPFGEVRPDGWIKEQMLRDLHQGFAGCLGQLCHEASSDIFVANRNSIAAQNSHNEMGVNWWNGETEGNWRAGHMMMACLVEDPASMREAERYVNRILASQDADGYLGAFAPDCRYLYPGELWTQTCLLRGLLAYAQLTAREDVLRAVRRAADLTVKVYGSREKPLPIGESHDLMFIDVLEALCALEDNAAYRQFALWYYETWSRQESKWDVTLPSLLDLNKGFVDHGVHTCENLRVPLWLASVTDRADIRQASENGFAKIARYSEVSGSAVSEEWIGDHSPDPALTEYEYCATKELQLTFASALQKTGCAPFGDRVETIWFNAAQGSRLADGSAISYLTSDNRALCNEIAANGKDHEKRNKFSPSHEDVAVCCNPNATQVAALFVRGMWMRHAQGGLVATLYGPCKVQTRIGNVSVTLEETTLYPFENTVKIAVLPARPSEFPLYLRNPGWSASTRVDCAGAHIERQGDYWKLTRRWTSGDIVRLEFSPEVREVVAVNGEIAVQYGALLFAQPIPSRKKSIRQYPLPHFEDSIYEPAESHSVDLAFPASERTRGFHMEPGDATADIRHPFDAPLIVLRGRMIAQGTSSPHDVTLVPLGNASVLRRVTFPLRA